MKRQESIAFNEKLYENECDTVCKATRMYDSNVTIYENKQATVCEVTREP